uniref:C-type lectin domain-containing protein n=1 Tax=Mastacembelus armatus TaxID=205130 RepID=A0A7N8YHE5_9TELE
MPHYRTAKTFVNSFHALQLKGMLSSKILLLSFILFSGTVRIKVIKENLTWEEAYNYCQANHTRLLQIEHKKDQEAVEQWLNSTDVESNLFWIGLRQSRVFGFWIWSNTACQNLIAW